MKPGEVVWHRKETTHYLGNGHYIVVRPAALDRRWVIDESTAFDGSRILESTATRAEADFIAVAYAAARGHQPATTDHAEA